MKVLLLSLALGLSPATTLFVSGQGATAPAASSTSTRDDDRIEDQVRIRLAGNRDTGGAGSIKVEVKGGVVTLTGKVESERVKSAAEKQAKKVKGVKSVANQLVIAPRM